MFSFLAQEPDTRQTGHIGHPESKLPTSSSINKPHIGSETAGWVLWLDRYAQQDRGVRSSSAGPITLPRLFLLNFTSGIVVRGMQALRLDSVSHTVMTNGFVSLFSQPGGCQLNRTDSCQSRTCATPGVWRSSRCTRCLIHASAVDMEPFSCSV
jgi:hypothetical protein